MSEKDEASTVAADCPRCPKGEGIGTPMDAREGAGDPSTARDPTHLFCVACGEHWHELSPRQLARAWYGWGAYVGGLP